MSKGNGNDCKISIVDRDQILFYALIKGLLKKKYHVTIKALRV